jgi:hypothetical protein
MFLFFYLKGLENRELSLPQYLEELAKCKTTVLTCYLDRSWEYDRLV